MVNRDSSLYYLSSSVISPLLILSLASSLIIDCNQQEIGHVEKRGKTQ